jgi:hypothetical protein
MPGPNFALRHGNAASAHNEEPANRQNPKTSLLRLDPEECANMIMSIREEQPAVKGGIPFFMKDTVNEIKEALLNCKRDVTEGAKRYETIVKTFARFMAMEAYVKDSPIHAIMPRIQEIIPYLSERLYDEVTALNSKCHKYNRTKIAKLIRAGNTTSDICEALDIPPASRRIVGIVAKANNLTVTRSARHRQATEKNIETNNEDATESNFEQNPNKDGSNIPKYDSEKIVNLINDGKTVTEIYAELGIDTASRWLVYQIAKDNGLKIKRSSRHYYDTEEIIRLIKEGKKDLEICKECNIPLIRRDVVLRVAKANNLTVIRSARSRQSTKKNIETNGDDAEEKDAAS